MNTHRKIIVIGAGPIGMNCAIEAEKAGLDCLVLEKGTLVNSIYNYPTQMHFFSTADRLEIGGVPFYCIAPKPGRWEALEYFRVVQERFGLDIHLHEKVLSVMQTENGIVQVTTDKQLYTCNYLVFATGFYDVPVKLGVPGEDLPKVRHYYKDPYEFSFQKVVVVGASNSAVDAALECYRKGADVTMVVRGAAINERVKYWVKPDIENRIGEGSIKAYFNATVSGIDETSCTVRMADGREIVLANDFVLALTGYEPYFPLLEQAGIRFSDDGLKKPVYDAVTMETNVPNVYLAGVVCGGLETFKWFIENSRVHSGMIVKDILEKEQNS